MTSVKIKFRASTIEGREGVLYYQIIRNRVIRQIATDYRLFASEWDEERETVAITLENSERQKAVKSINERLKLDLRRLSHIVDSLNKKSLTYTADDVVATFEKVLQGHTIVKFTQGVIARLKELRKERTSETYATTLNSFMRFREGEDLLLTDISSDLMMTYEAYLKYEGVSMNSISFYMRILRAIYNRAVEQELVEQKFPFKHVYTGVDKTLKRALPLKYIKQIKEMDLANDYLMNFARDMFILSFYTRGMSFIDMAYLRKKDLNNGVLAYRRRKTGQQLHIKWEKCMQEILSKYPSNDTQYLLPIIKVAGDSDRSQYKNALYYVNTRLKKIAGKLSLPIPLTMYVARHSWANVAKSKNVPISVISEGMGHDSEATTQIYLASLDTAIVDKANNMILKLLR